MALIIPNLKLGNKTTENAYAKVGRVNVDNNTKKATFNIFIYKSKTDETILTTIAGLSFAIIEGLDIINQCIAAAILKVTDVKNTIASMQAEVDADLTHSNRKLIWDLSVLKANKILLLDGAVEDI